MGGSIGVGPWCYEDVDREGDAEDEGLGEGPRFLFTVSIDDRLDGRLVLGA